MIESSSCRLAGGLALSERESHVPLLDSSGLAGGRRSLRLDAGSLACAGRQPESNKDRLRCQTVVVHDDAVGCRTL